MECRVISLTLNEEQVSCRKLYMLYFESSSCKNKFLKNIRGMKLKTIKILLATVLSSILLISCATTQKPRFSGMNSPILAERGVKAEKISDEADLVDAIKALGLPVYNEAIISPKELTLEEAVLHIVAAASMTELAKTIAPKKSRRILTDYALNSTGNPKYDQAIAAAVTTGLVDSSWYTQNIIDRTLDSDDLSYLLQSALNFQGETTSYLGRTSDASIYGAIMNSWKNYNIVQVPDLLAIVDKAVIKGIVTGYNVLDSRDNANFDPALSITYGHNDIKHALQLIGLLQSEGLDAKVDFQGKTSAYVYLDAWGTPVENDTLKIKKIPGGNYVAYAKEYNLTLEFNSAADKADFNRVILAYAKKDTKNEPGLIYASWWQPLYSSATQMGEGYRTISDHVIIFGLYEVHPFSLNQNAQKVVADFHKIDPNLKIKSKVFWVNQAFYNYLEGKSK